MNVIVRGKNVPITTAIQRYVAKKIGRLARYWPSLWQAEVTCATEPTRAVETRQHVEANVDVGGLRFHAEEWAGDLYVAIDGVAEKLEQQLRRKKGSLTDRRRRTAVWDEPAPAPAEPGAGAPAPG